MQDIGDMLYNKVDRAVGTLLNRRQMLKGSAVITGGLLLRRPQSGNVTHVPDDGVEYYLNQGDPQPTYFAVPPMHRDETFKQQCLRIPELEDFVRNTLRTTCVIDYQTVVPVTEHIIVPQVPDFGFRYSERRWGRFSIRELFPYDQDSELAQGFYEAQQKANEIGFSDIPEQYGDLFVLIHNPYEPITIGQGSMIHVDPSIASQKRFTQDEKTGLLIAAYMTDKNFREQFGLYRPDGSIWQARKVVSHPIKVMSGYTDRIFQEPQIGRLGEDTLFFGMYRHVDGGFGRKDREFMQDIWVFNTDYGLWMKPAEDLIWERTPTVPLERGTTELISN